MWGWVYEEGRGVGMWLSTLVPVVLERDKHFVVRFFPGFQDQAFWR
jgi:hypothetical protein